MSTFGQDPSTVVKISERLWSDEVGRALADELIPPYDPAYKFNNGREFVVKTHYYPANTEPADNPP